MSDRETEGDQGKEIQLNEYAVCFNLNMFSKKGFYEMQYVADGVDSVAHRHKLVTLNVWETLACLCYFPACTQSLLIDSLL